MIYIEEVVERVPGWLVLQDGTAFGGNFVRPQALEDRSVGDVVAEVVFTTSMSGYQEAMTDPSYHGQMICFTTSHLGNYGVTGTDDQSSRIWAAGMIGARYSEIASNYRAHTTLASWLHSAGVPLFVDVDARRLTTHLRTHGSMPGVLTTRDPDVAHMLVRDAKGTIGQDLVSEVSTTSIRDLGHGAWHGKRDGSDPGLSLSSVENLVVVDFGIKEAMLTSLRSPWHTYVVPARTPASEILALNPSAVFLSNGPGDPSALGWAVAEIRKLLGVVPIAGICLGHQLLALAVGAKTSRLEFGHHGSNHPVLHVPSGKVAITAQNHSYVVDEESLRDCAEQVEITHVNLFDRVVEGVRYPDLGIVSVQYHPEAAPGPNEQYWEMNNALVELIGARR
ncbi:MAG: glutamine-hydrolyzing carbamoyl-phosphate synthase small subunit [Ferrimicrobium sp.]